MGSNAGVAAVATSLHAHRHSGPASVKSRTLTPGGCSMPPAYLSQAAATAFAFDLVLCSNIDRPTRLEAFTFIFLLGFLALCLLFFAVLLLLHLILAATGLNSRELRHRMGGRTALHQHQHQHQQQGRKPRQQPHGMCTQLLHNCHAFLLGLPRDREDRGHLSGWDCTAQGQGRRVLRCVDWLCDNQWWSCF